MMLYHEIVIKLLQSNSMEDNNLQLEEDRNVINIDAKAPGSLPPVLGWNTWCTQNQCGSDWCTEDEIISVGTAMKKNGLSERYCSQIKKDISVDLCILPFIEGASSLLGSQQ